MKKLLTVGLALFVIISAKAQSIRGIVKDENNQPLPYISVTLNGSFNGTITNQEGFFELKTTGQGLQRLEVTGAGFQPFQQELAGNDTSIIRIILKQSFSSLKEITVTAGRKPEIVDRTPASVQVVNAAEIRTQSLISPNIANVLAQAVPALAFGTNTTSNTGQTLRGRTPLILIDGIPQSTPLRAGGREIRSIDPAVIERIEVVKGATAIYGNGADGGVINYITKKNLNSQPFNANTYVGLTGMPVHGKETYGARILQQFSGAKKKFDYVVNGSYEKTGVAKSADGVALTPVYGLGESNIYNAFAKIGYNLNSKHRFEAMYNYFGSAQNTDYIEKTGVYLQTPTIGVKGEHIGEKEGTRYNHNAYLKYQGKQIYKNTDLEASAYLQSFYTIYGYTSFFEGGGQSTIKSKKRGARITANTSFNQKGILRPDLVYGVDLMNDRTSQLLTDGRTWVPELDLFNIAPYVQASAEFNDFVLKAGIRYDNISVEVPDFTQVKDANGGGGQFVKGGTIAFDATTFNAGLRYARWEVFKPFVSFTQGFSIIDIGRYVRAAKENDIAKMEIEPVVVNNLEFGFSSNIGWLQLNAAYFVSKNKVGASLTEVNGSYIQQKAPEKTEGIEASVDVKPFEQFSAGVAYVYVEGKADVNKNDKFGDDEDIYLNGTKISAPKLTSYIRYSPVKAVSLYLQYLHLSKRDRFDVRSNGRYGYGEGPVTGIDLVNFSSTLQLNKKLQLSLGVENLLNADYFTPLAQWSTQNADYSKGNGIRMQLGIGFKW